MISAPTLGRYAHDGMPGVLDCLSDILDMNTTDLLDDYLSIEEGLLPERSRTLLLGAGRGTMALWVANGISSGSITALDMDTSRIRPEVHDHDRVEVVICDLLTDALPAGPWDLVHARLLFAQLPNRRELLRDVVDVLAPGGAVMIEEWGVAGPGRVLDAPNPRTKYLYQKYQKALISVFAADDNDPEWSIQVHAEMRAAGLVNVETHTRAQSWAGGSPGCQLPIAASIGLEDRLVQHGVTHEDLEDLRHDLADPQLALVGNLTWSTFGRRAAG